MPYVGTNRIGINAIFNTKSFKIGAKEYMSVLDRVKDRTKYVANSVSGFSTGGAIGLAGITAGFGLIAIAATAAVGAITVTTKAMTELITESTAYAGRIQELGIVVDLLGTRSGYTKTQLDQYEKEVRSFNVTGDATNYLLANMARYQLDLAKATDFARIAQGAAVIMGQDSSVALEHMMYGIITYNKRVLRTAGLNIDLQGSFEKYAESVGKTSAELTELEKVQVAFNEVLRVGDKELKGVYEAAMLSPTKQWRSLRREVLEFQEVLGEPFLRAWLYVTQGIKSFLDAITQALAKGSQLGKSFNKGGSLYQAIVNLAGAIQFIAEAFKLTAENSDQFVENLGYTLLKLQEYMADAFEWGFRFITEFATGIVRGATTVLVSAIQLVGNLIAKWFRPHSPPLIVPYIDEWGAATMAEWLHGFTNIDWDVFDSIKAPLKDALTIIFDDDEQAIKTYAAVYKEMIEALGQGEQIGEDFYEKVRLAAGAYGEEIALLARRQTELAVAEELVAEAEKRIEEAKKREERASAAVNMGIRQYNDMLRKGASRQQLAAKKKEIDAAYAEREAAKQARIQAEADLEVRKQLLEIAKEQLDMQKKLVDALLEYAKLLEDIERKRKSGGGGGEFDEEDFGGLGGGIGDAFAEFNKDVDEEAKKLKLRFASLMKDAFKPLVTEWEKAEIKFWIAVAQLRAELNNAFGPGWRETINEIWNILFNPEGAGFDPVATGARIAEKMKGSLWTGLATGSGIGSVLEKWWKEEKVSWDAEWAKTDVDMKAKWSSLLAWFSTRGATEGVLSKWWKGEKVGWDVEWAKTEVDVKAKWGALWKAVTNIAATEVLAIQSLWKATTDYIKDVLKAFGDGIKGDWDSFWSGLLSTITNTWDEISRIVTNAVDGVKREIEKLIRMVLPDWLLRLLNMNGGVKFAPKAMGGYVESGSPYLVGERGAELFVPSRGGTIVPHNELVRSMFTVPQTPMPVTVSAGKQVVINMGGVNIYGTTDATKLDARIQRSVRRGMSI